MYMGGKLIIFAKYFHNIYFEYITVCAIMIYAVCAIMIYVMSDTLRVTPQWLHTLHSKATVRSE
jgi:hypothetical protein